MLIACDDDRALATYDIGPGYWRCLVTGPMETVRSFLEDLRPEIFDTRAKDGAVTCRICVWFPNFEEPTKSINRAMQKACKHDCTLQLLCEGDNRPNEYPVLHTGRHGFVWEPSL